MSYEMVKYFCYKCGGFVAKIAQSKVPKDARITVVCVCQNKRCKTDNVIHIENGEVQRMNAVEFAYEYPKLEKTG